MLRPLMPNTISSCSNFIMPAANGSPTDSVFSDPASADFLAGLASADFFFCMADFADGVDL